jgi:hypothetical protein
MCGACSIVDLLRSRIRCVRHGKKHPIQRGELLPLAMPLREGVHPHSRSVVHDALPQLIAAESNEDRFDRSALLSAAIAAGLIRDRSRPTPQLVRDEKGTEFVVRTLEGAANEASHFALTAFHENFLQGFEMGSHGFSGSVFGPLLGDQRLEARR